LLPLLHDQKVIDASTVGLVLIRYLRKNTPHSFNYVLTKTFYRHYWLIFQCVFLCGLLTKLRTGSGPELCGICAPQLGAVFLVITNRVSGTLAAPVESRRAQIRSSADSRRVCLQLSDKVFVLLLARGETFHPPAAFCCCCCSFFQFWPIQFVTPSTSDTRSTAWRREASCHEIGIGMKPLKWEVFGNTSWVV